VSRTAPEKISGAREYHRFAEWVKAAITAGLTKYLDAYIINGIALRVLFLRPYIYPLK
jgi:hypothetical protein